MREVISTINQAWNWKGFTATEAIRINDFGNVIFKTALNEYWRLCPEELSCHKIASSATELNQVLTEQEFIDDWEMDHLVKEAKAVLGELAPYEKFYLVLPGVLGGQYNVSNIRKISFQELIRLSGDLGFQIKDLKDGDEVKLTTTDRQKKDGPPIGS
ncbi:T6SS immunity protein Tdi1 domain-containing protein [Lewinella sp. W8]|uniref:T6SS immunity protein Tdi1 domain-containing protein n=1 Tax=Lewinella sp. W8 TaxID=2528208 RepID=UPI001067494D|nr:T6SS immunity protein Tdi1 domain-containing protein [Lewinella sp. W8]MTB52630.1 DUF1851 domain-containing protein [Lewinella sp. W8]